MTKRKKQTYEPKPLFFEKINELLTNKEDNESYWEILKTEPVNSIRCNTLKISPENLIKKLKEKNWILSQPWEQHPEIIIVEGKKPTRKENEIIIEKNLTKLEPGELGKSLEYLLGYYCIQELSSTLPLIAMTPKENELCLDICATHGNKTTQAAAKMNNRGTIIANEISTGKIKSLISNLEKCGVTNTIITKKERKELTKIFEIQKIKFDKILLDAPCSEEGTIRSSPKKLLTWNPKTIKSLSHLQKQFFKKSFEQLKVGGEMIYSTCTHAPEENEEVVDTMLTELGDQIKIVGFELPIKTRPGLSEWKGKIYNERVKHCQRVYPQDNNTEGLFISKFRRVK